MVFSYGKLIWSGNKNKAIIGNNYYSANSEQVLMERVEGQETNNIGKLIEIDKETESFFIQLENGFIKRCFYIYPVGKSYAKRDKSYIESNRDYYPTPKGLTLELLQTNELNACTDVLEPSCGNMAISNILIEHGFNVTSRDIVSGNDFLVDDYTGEKYDAIVTNPPFTLFDKFVLKAKSIDCKKIIFIGRTNHFASHSTNVNGIWDELSDVYIFDRQVAYDRPFREDGKCECGCLVTGWFVWTKGYKEAPRIHILDVQKWIAKKGESDNE